MKAVNSKNEVIEVKDKFVHFLDASIREKEMREFTEYLNNAFRENADFAYCCQPLFTNEMVVFFCRTEVSSSSQIVRNSLEIEKHLDEPQETIDLMQSLFSRKETGRIRWYYLTVGAFTFERNICDGKPIAVYYAQPVSYAKFIRNYERNLLTEDELRSGELCTGYRQISGVRLNDPMTLLSCSFERDMFGGASQKDKQMYQFCKEWEQKRTRTGGKDSNRATFCLIQIGEKRKDCYPNYKEVKNLIKKRFHDSYKIQYHNNVVTAMLNDSTSITLYISGTVNHPLYVIGGKTAGTLEELGILLDDKIYEHEEKWFSDMKPYI